MSIPVKTQDQSAVLNNGTFERFVSLTVVFAGDGQRQPHLPSLPSQRLQAGGSRRDLQVPGGEPRRGGGRHGPAHHPLPAPGEAPAPGLAGEAHRLQAGDLLLRVRGPQALHRLEENEQVSVVSCYQFLILTTAGPCQS